MQRNVQRLGNLYIILGQQIELICIFAHYKKLYNTMLTFIFNGHYELQMAVYQQLIKQTFGKMCEPVIVGVTKQTPPDMQAFDFESDGAKAAMANALEVVKNKQDHFWNVLMGEEPPKACGHCDYCRTKARLTDPVPFDMYDWPE